MAIPDDVKQWRKAERARLLALREAIPLETRRAHGERITQHIVEAFPQLARMTFGFYWPLRGEYDARIVAMHFRKLGARTALPVVVQKAAPLQFRLWWPGAPTSFGVYDLPVPETEVVVPQAVLMPPIGFDGACYRLGYGGGFFDRTLAAMSPQPLKIGVAYDALRIETIRPQPHDIAMDCVVTESGIRQRASPPR